jgi:hypothetical protein
MIIPQVHTIAWRIQDIFLQQLAIISQWVLGMFRWTFCGRKLFFRSASWLEKLGRLNALGTRSRNTNSLVTEANRLTRTASNIQTRSIKREALFNTKGENYIKQYSTGSEHQFW